MQPETRYAKSGEINIAYQVVGEGPMDLLFCIGWLSNIEMVWEEPSYARFLRRLASFSRLILFDKRGTGLSDRLPLNQLPTVEDRMDDLRAVMDAAGSERAALFGFSEGSVLAALFAATYPARCVAIILYGAAAKVLQDDETPWGLSREFSESFIASFESQWGTAFGIEMWAPTVAGDEGVRQWFARNLRQSASPQAAVAMARWIMDIDIRPILPVIQVPTLIIHRKEDQLFPVDHGRDLARRLPTARYVEIEGSDHLPYFGNSDVIVDEVQEFLTGERVEVAGDRVLLTVMFVDIVNSTARASEIGDRRWLDNLEAFYALARQQLSRFRGTEVNTTGDGLLATFDGPARAIRCATTLRDDARRLGVQLRLGLHTGECAVGDGDIRGISVHIGARVAAAAKPDEVLVTSTVRDLVAGAGLHFTDRGTQWLKGLPEEWRLFAVEL